MTREGTTFLSGRTALVTGGARRIGRELATALAAAGATVVVHYRESRAEAHDLAAGIAMQGGGAFIVGGDLADPETAAALPAEAARVAARPLDILINNASIFAPGGLADTSCADWDANQAVNLRAPFLLSQAFAAQLPADGRADIVNLNDYRALKPGADHFAYTISKVGLHGLTRSLAQALAPRVRVNELALGAILPPAGAADGYAHVRREDIPLQAFGDPAQVSDALLYLLGADGVTGQTLSVDGGRHLT
jgi:NAD(P)-dependent dehydrogenase (short-subunit alcohol dehydrogenase family)